MMRQMLMFLLLIGVAAMVSAQEKGYKIVRPDGTVEFSDQPAPGAKEITLPKVQGYEAPPPPPLTPRTPPTVPQAADYTRVALLAPVNDETYFDGEEALHVNVEVLPALHPEHHLVILLDGQVVAEGRNTRFNLHGIERGTHTLLAQVRDAQGKPVQSTAPVTFHWRQHSRFFQPAPQPGAPSAIPPAPMMPQAPRAP